MNSLAPLLLALLPLLSTAAEHRIVCFGDSTTAPRTNVIPYCEQIQRPGLVTLNRGIPSNTTEHGRARFQKDVLDAKPDIVIIQFGINDSSVDTWKTPPATEPRVTIARYTENLNFFVDSLQAARIRVILMTFNPLTWTPKMKELYGKPPYRPNRPDGLNQGRQPYLDAIRHIAKTRQITLIDIDAAYQNWSRNHSIDDLLLDGIHPNTKGHTLTADLLRPVLD